MLLKRFYLWPLTLHSKYLMLLSPLIVHQNRASTIGALFLCVYPAHIKTRPRWLPDFKLSQLEGKISRRTRVTKSSSEVAKKPPTITNGTTSCKSWSCWSLSLYLHRDSAAAFVWGFVFYWFLNKLLVFSYSVYSLAAMVVERMLLVHIEASTQL